MTGAGEKPLPVLRAVFEDAHGTWVHIDPATGAVLGRLDSHRRASRWLFGMLHSWDWLPLLQHRPAWDALLIALSLGGTAMLATLAASASYIAVPAALRLALPEANPSLSLTASLGITFPFNILIGIPLYLALAEQLIAWGL